MAEEKPEMTHLDARGQLHMVDVGDKEPTDREARAECRVRVSDETFRRIAEGTVPKGNVFEAARLAGILAAKRTWELIPLCHSIQLTGIDLEFMPEPEKTEIRVASRVRTRDRTGVEMEAMVAVANAALTIYDMCKAIDRSIVIDGIQLTYKSGGKSGTFVRS